MGARGIADVCVQSGDDALYPSCVCKAPLSFVSLIAGMIEERLHGFVVSGVVGFRLKGGVCMLLY